MKNNSRLSIKKLAKKETEELRRIVELRSDTEFALIDNDKELLEEFFQVGIRLVGIFPLAYCAVDIESLPDPLRDWVEDGDLDKLFPPDLRGEDMLQEQAEFLSQKGGFLVVFNAQIWDYSNTTFDKEGVSDGTMGSGWGYYSTSYIWVDSYSKINEAIVDEYTNLRESWIRSAAKKSEKSLKNI